MSLSKKLNMLAGDSSFDSDEELEDDDSDEYDFMGTGYFRDDLELMDDDERIEILLDAGVDIDDCDF